MKGITAMGLFLALSAVAAPALAQRHSELRTVHGTVMDKDSNPIDSAVVYLKNVRTLTVKTYITDRAGRYRFSGLDPNVDYELHAEHGNLTSRDHTISSFDSRNEIVISLKVDREKKKNEK